MSNEILTPVGRMVQGHPMELHPVMDNAGQPKINRAGQPQQQAFVALAIPKGTEQHWNQTEWGAQIHAAGVASWPNGEHGAPTFAWKITDGDSTVPNRKGKQPCNNEGFPGHWIINASNGFAPDCFANGNYASQVMRKETFKNGDYVRLVLSVKGNGSTDSPGVYMNMMGCELIQAGVLIQSASSLDAQSTFGAVAAALPAGAQIDPNIPAVNGAAPQTAPVAPSAAPATDAPAASPVPPAGGNTAPPPAPAHDFLTVDGQQYTAQALRDGGWTEEQIAAAR